MRRRGLLSRGAVLRSMAGTMDQCRSDRGGRRNQRLCVCGPEPDHVQGRDRHGAQAPQDRHGAQDPKEPKPPLTAKEAAAIAEGSGKGALVKKYSSVGTVVDITPAGKNVSATGVDAHLIVGKGKEAVNVIADVKHASPTKSGGEAPVRYSGKEKGVMSVRLIAHPSRITGNWFATSVRHVQTDCLIRRRLFTRSRVPRPG